MKKETLVIIPGFSTNSQMLKDVVEYLEQYFEVRCIDIPGYCKQKPPMSMSSIDQLILYLKSELKKIEKEKYYLAGISFGYYLANQVCDPKACHGIIAIYPFLSAKHLKMNNITLQLLKTGVQGINTFKLSQSVWKSSLFPSILGLTGVSKKEMELMFAHIDATTFFATANFVLSSEKEVIPPDIPHVVVVNDEDVIINTPTLLKSFTKLHKTLLLKSPIPHFPSALNKHQIQQTFPPELIQQAKRFLCT